MHVYIHMIAYRNRNHTFFIYRAIDHLAAPIGYACSKTKERIFPVCKISLVSFQRPDYQIGGISRPSVILIFYEQNIIYHASDRNLTGYRSQKENLVVNKIQIDDNADKHCNSKNHRFCKSYISLKLNAMVMSRFPTW